jgi:triosephosphate isomerase
MARKTLITARDLEQQPSLIIPEHALLTPLAKDLLRKRGLWPAPRRKLYQDKGPRRVVVANWKSHKTIPEALTFARELRGLREGKRTRAAAVVCPPSTALASLVGPLRGVAELGSQDVSAHGEGAHTGELAPRHLVDAGARYAIVGHSERRAAGESDALCRAKVRNALGGGLAPILCVGETKDEREAGRAFNVVSTQLEGALDGMTPDAFAKVVVAYEPRWAIGTGLVPTHEDVVDMLAHVRTVLGRVGQEEVAARVPVLYGGSVNEKNAAELLHLPGCAGALVGGAGLSPERFAKIIAAS